MAKNRSWYPWQPDTGTPLHPVLRQVHDDRTLGERVADRIASFGGSWPFILMFAAIMAVWISINVVQVARFDPFPFILLNLVLSTVAAIQAPIIMMSQNRQASKDKLLAENDYQVNLKAEMEIEAMLRNQAEMMARVALIERLIVRRAGTDVFDNHKAAPQIPESSPVP